jgi:poly(A) polymerase
MPQNPQREFALDIVRQLREADYEALWAGGCVRDQLLGLKPKDYDVATNARPEEVQQLFGERRTLAIGAAFGVIAVLGKNCNPVEVATFRSDHAYVDGRRPSRVEFTTAKQDAERRDFTINGMFFDPLSGEVIDYVGGQADLMAGTIRAIGDPRARFDEDKLRILRAVRFATAFDFVIEPDTLAAIQEMAHEVTVVSAERIGAELSRLLIHPRRGIGVRLLNECGLLRPLIPELADEAECESPRWQKTLDNLERLESTNLATAMASLVSEHATTVRVSALGRRFRFANKEIDLATWLVKQLSRIAEAEQLPWTQLQRILTHESAAELMTLAFAALGNDHAGVLKCQEYLALPVEKLNPSPLLTGDDLVRHGFQPGPKFAGLLTAVRDAQLEGRISNQAEALELVERLVRRQQGK